CVFEAGTATLGAGIYGLFSAPTLDDCSFQNNSGNSGDIDCGAGTNAVVSNTSFAAGSEMSSAIRIFGGGPSFTDCSFADSSRVARVLVIGGSPSFTNCHWVTTSGGSAGAVYAHFNSSPAFTGCTVTNTRGQQAGAFWFADSANATVT